MSVLLYTFALIFSDTTILISFQFPIVVNLLVYANPQSLPRFMVVDPIFIPREILYGGDSGARVSHFRRQEVPAIDLIGRGDFPSIVLLGPHNLVHKGH